MSSSLTLMSRSSSQPSWKKSSSSKSPGMTKSRTGSSSSAKSSSSRSSSSSSRSSSSNSSSSSSSSARASISAASASFASTAGSEDSDSESKSSAKTSRASPSSSGSSSAGVSRRRLGMTKKPGRFLSSHCRPTPHPGQMLGRLAITSRARSGSTDGSRASEAAAAMTSGLSRRASSPCRQDIAERPRRPWGRVAPPHHARRRRWSSPRASAEGVARAASARRATGWALARRARGRGDASPDADVRAARETGRPSLPHARRNIDPWFEGVDDASITVDEPGRTRVGARADGGGRGRGGALFASSEARDEN